MVPSYQLQNLRIYRQSTCFPLFFHFPHRCPRALSESVILLFSTSKQREKKIHELKRSFGCRENCPRYASVASFLPQNLLPQPVASPQAMKNRCLITGFLVQTTLEFQWLSQAGMFIFSPLFSPKWIAIFLCILLNLFSWVLMCSESVCVAIFIRAHLFGWNWIHRYSW